MKRLMLLISTILILLLSTIVLADQVIVTMEEGEVQNFTLGSNQYQVEVVIIDENPPAGPPPIVLFRINGQLSNQLIINQTQLIQGILLRVINITINEQGKGGGGDTVRFSLTYDITPPEIKVKFNPSINDFDIIAIDNDDPEVLVEYTVVGQEEGWEIRHYSLIDDLLNQLSFKAKYKTVDNKVKFKILNSLTYNGNKVHIPRNLFVARYDGNKFIQRLEKGQMTVLAIYRPELNQTNIKYYYNNQFTGEVTFDELLLISLFTNQGNLIHSFYDGY